MNELETLIGEITSGDESQAEAAVQKIHKYGEKAIEFLQPLLSSPDPDLRWWGVFALAGIISSETPQILCKMLKDSDPVVRQGAALGLRQNPSEAAIPDLIARLADKDPMVVHLSAAALAANGSAAVDPLLELLKSASLPVRLEILRALASIGDTRSIPALFEALGQDSALKEHWANEGLQHMGVGMNYFKPGEG